MASWRNIYIKRMMFGGMRAQVCWTGSASSGTQHPARYMCCDVRVCLALTTTRCSEGARGCPGGFVWGSPGTWWRCKRCISGRTTIASPPQTESTIPYWRHPARNTWSTGGKARLRLIESRTFYLNVSCTYVLSINHFDVLAFLQSADNLLLSSRVCYDWAATGPTAWN